MTPSGGDMGRLEELLADRAGGEPLTASDTLEMDRLLGLYPDVSPASFESAAAAIHLALLRPDEEALPVRLRGRILDEAGSYFGGDPGSRGPRPLSNPWLGWLAAAAAVLMLLLARGARPEDPLRPAHDQVSQASDAVAADWSATEDPGGAGVTGEVVWSDALQMGYMRFRGLPENDPGEGQYQLWIFDAERPAEYPVDGGVFDSTGSDVLVPIDAKLAVAEPTLFAITYERPGGVVVSSRERLLLTASLQ